MGHTKTVSDFACAEHTKNIELNADSEQRLSAPDGEVVLPRCEITEPKPMPRAPEYQPARQPALSHGLTAELPVSEEEARLLEQTVEAWAYQAGAESDIEHAYIRKAALASLRLRRCERAEIEAMDRNVRQALRDWSKTKRRNMRKKAQELESDPAGTLEELESCGYGCDWVLGRWKALARALERGEPWRFEPFRQAMWLTGRPMQEPATDDTEGRALWEAAVAAGSPTSCLPGSARKADGKSCCAESPEERDAALGRLRQFVAARIERLEALRPGLHERVEAAEQRAVEAEARIDISKAGQLRQRYDREADLSMQRNMNQFIKLKTLKIRERELELEQYKANVVPRRAVGGGWWKEPNAAPAPPGFIPEPDPSHQTLPCGTGAQRAQAQKTAAPSAKSTQSAESAPPKPASSHNGEGSDREFDSPTGARFEAAPGHRIEAVSEAESAEFEEHNLLSEEDFDHAVSSRSAAGSERTEGVPKGFGRPDRNGGPPPGPPEPGR